MTVSAGSLQALPAPVRLKGCGVNRVESKDAERRYAIFAEVLILVVAPDQNEVRVEQVQSCADSAKSFNRTIAMCGCGPAGLVFCPLLSHLRGPVRWVSGSRWQPWAVQHTLENPGHPFFIANQQGGVRYSQPQDFGHWRAFLL